MAFPDKRLLVTSVAGKAETTYGSENAPTWSTDAFYPQFSSTDNPELVPEDFVFDGDLGPNAAGNGPTANVAPSGRGAKLTLPMYPWLPGIAYSSSVTPLNGFHHFLKLCGYAAVGSFSAGSEKWTYTMAADSVTPYSETLYVQTAQVLGASTMEQVKIFGGLGNLKMSFDSPKPPIFTAEIMGIYGSDPTEAATGAPTLVRSPLPPLSSNCALSYGAFSTPVLYSGDFDLGRKMDPRSALNNTGAHLGYVPREHDPILTVFIERTKFATWNPFTIRAAASTAALNLTFGSTQYVELALDAPYAQLFGPIKGVNKGGTACWQLQFRLPGSTPTANDGHTWTAK